MVRKQNRFQIVTLVACGLACAVSASARAQDVGEPPRPAQTEKTPALKVPATGLRSDRNFFAQVARPIAAPRSVLGTTRLPKGRLGALAATPTLIWRLGPSVERPTAPDDPLATDTWSAGVASVAVAIEGVRWYGALASDRCSLAGDVDRGNANGFQIQPFLNYNLADGWYVTSVPVISVDWAAPSGEKWTVPLGATFGRFVRLGDKPLALQAGYYYNLEKPGGAGDWEVRFQLRLLFPG